MLRAYVHPQGDDWDEKLSDMEFAYNNSEQRSTGQTPFYVLHGFHPRTPLDNYNREVSDTPAADVPAAEQFVKQMVEGHEAAAESMRIASQQQKENYDAKRQAADFKKGDWVVLSSDKYKFQGRTDKLTDRFLGPYQILELKGEGAAATLKLPPNVRTHPTVSVTRLKHWHGKKSLRGVPEDATKEPIAVEEDRHEPDQEHEATGPEEIKFVEAYRNVERSKPPHEVIRQEFLVSWIGRGPESDAWVTASRLGKERAEREMEQGYLDEQPAVRKVR